MNSSCVGKCTAWVCLRWMFFAPWQGDSFHAICDGCDDVVCYDCFLEAQLTPKCTPAFEHSTSSGRAVTIHGLEIDEGYWRATTSSTTILACYNPDACVGGITGTSSYCTEGSEGPCKEWCCLVSIKVLLSVWITQTRGFKQALNMFFICGSKGTRHV